MIFTCPNCGTQYVVKDGAIPPEGRQVRCAACKHSWHQNPEGGDQAAVGMTGELEAAEPAYEAPADAGAVEQNGIGETEGAGKDEESLSEAALIDPRSGPEAEERAYEEAVIDGDAEPPPSAEAAGEVEEAAPAAQDWREPPEAEAAPDMFSPFAEVDDQPRRRSGLR